MNSDSLNNIELKNIVKKIRPLTIPLILLSILIMASASYMIIQIDNQPLKSEETIKVTEYTHKGEYTYTAELGNNTYYNDERTLMPGEGPLFKNIVEYLNISFNYDLHSLKNPIRHFETVSQEFHLIAEEAFTKTLSESELDRLMERSPARGEWVRLNVTETDIYFEEISDDTGVASSQLTLEALTTVRVGSSFHEEKIDETLQYPLIIMLYGSEAGSSIDLSELSKTETHDITKTITIKLEPDENRVYYVVLFGAGGVFLIATVILHFTVPYKAKKKTEVEKLIDKYRDNIVKSDQAKSQATNEIEISDIDELNKLSESLLKPIIYLETPEGHLFYVLDADTIYQHTIKTENQT